MATQTIELHEMVDNLLEYQYDLRKLTHMDKIRKVAPIIFNFNYPIFDEKYRDILNVKILSAYYMNELGFETYGEWHFRLEEFMNRRMPYYNRLYVSMLENDYDPFDNIGYKDTYTRSNDSNRDSFSKQHYTDNTKLDGTTHGNGNSTSTGETSTTGNETGNVKANTVGKTKENVTGTATDIANKRTIGEDTPQSNIEASLQHASNIATTNSNDSKNTTSIANTDLNSDSNTDSTTDTTNKGTYNDNTNTKNDGSEHSNVDGKGDNSANANEKFNNVEDYLFERHGRNGSTTVGKLIADQRKNIIDVDTQLINDMRDLFYLVYSY